MIGGGLQQPGLGGMGGGAGLGGLGGGAGLGGMGGGLAEQQLGQFYLAQEGNETTRGMLAMPGADLGEKALSFVKLLISGSLGGGMSSPMGAGQLGGMGLDGMSGLGGGLQGMSGLGGAGLGQQMMQPTGSFLGM